MSAEPKLSQYLHSKAIKYEIPVSGTFELTNRCNFNCEMCYVHNECSKTRELTTEQWLSLAEDAKNAGTLFLLLTGGEPLLRDDFELLYTKFKKMGFIVSINTNGSLLHRYSELFKNNPPSRINISLYGSDDDAYRSLCKSDSFSTVFENIRRMKAAGISVKLNTVFTPKNKYQYKEILDIGEMLDLPVSTTSYAYPQVRLDKNFGENGCRMSPVEAAECTVKCEEYRFRRGGYDEKAKRILAEPDSDKCDRVSCRAGRAAYWITSEGKMQACGMMPAVQTDVLENGFIKAWQDIVGKVKEIRLPKECIGCRYSDICHVCAAMCYAETGCFELVPEYVCQLSKGIYDLTEKKLINSGD